MIRRGSSGSLGSPDCFTVPMKIKLDENCPLAAEAQFCPLLCSPELRSRFPDRER